MESVRFSPIVRFLSIALVASAVSLTGCGSGEDAVDGAASQDNSFPPAKNPYNDFNSGTTGDSNNSVGLERNEVRVTMEVPPGVAPSGAEVTRRNLRIVTPDRIEVYRTDRTLRNLASVETSSRREPNGREVIAFANGLPIGPDVIIEARYGNTVMRALAADADRDVKVNPFSEYLVTNTLSDYTPDEFQRILDCVDDASGELCLNKYVWSTLADQVHDFEIDMPDGSDLARALSHLEGRGDFARYVSSMADYALLGEQSSGKISASSADYNSVLLGIELGQTFLEPSFSGSGQWGVRTAQEESVTDRYGTGYVYPGLTLTSFDAFNIRVTSLASDVPYDRDTLIHQEGNEFFFRGQSTWELNTHASSPGAATLEDDTRLLAGRALYQSISNRGSSWVIGWTRNPYYLDAYLGGYAGGNEAPDRVVSGYFSAGKAIKLRPENGELKREKLLEDHYVSILEVNLLRQEGFQISQLDGDRYNVLYLSTPMGSGTTPMAVESGLGRWEIQGNRVELAMDTVKVERDNTGTVSADPAGSRTGTWAVSERPSRLSGGQANIGRLSLDTDINNRSNPDEKPQLGIGASNPDGSVLAFNLDNATTGNGILIAAEYTSSIPSGGRFRLQGLSLGMADDSNRLIHYDNGVLTIDSASQATLASRSLEVTHEVAMANVNGPVPLEDEGETFTYASGANGRVSFTNNSGTLVLDGFVTPGQNEFFLQLRETRGSERILGLVMATRLPE